MSNKRARKELATALPGVTTAKQRVLETCDLLRHVCTFLTTRELCRARTVKKGAWWKATTRPALWSRLDLSGGRFPSDDHILRMIERAGTELKALNLDRVTLDDPQWFGERLAVLLHERLGIPRPLTLSFRGLVDRNRPWSDINVFDLLSLPPPAAAAAAAAVNRDDDGDDSDSDLGLDADEQGPCLLEVTHHRPIQLWIDDASVSDELEELATTRGLKALRVNRLVPGRCMNCGTIHHLQLVEPFRSPGRNDVFLCLSCI